MPRQRRIEKVGSGLEFQADLVRTLNMDPGNGPIRLLGGTITIGATISGDAVIVSEDTIEA
jgi:hypothetical protein